MVEIDMRLTKDSVLIAQHDADFKRFFGIDQQVSDLMWREIKKFRSNPNNTQVMTLEEVFKNCEGRIQVMIDNKVSGNDTALFTGVVDLLKKYNLQKNAMMIGRSESTEFFIGKIKLSSTKKQLEEYKKRLDYNSSHYFLFAGAGELSQEDVEWAEKEGIMTVGVINRPYKQSENYMEEAVKFAKESKLWGVRYFQIDSEFDAAFREQ